MRAITLSAILLALGTSGAAEQPAPIQAPRDFSALELKVGDTIYVTDLTTGVEVNGLLGSLSADSLSIGGYRFDAGMKLRIDRAGDPVWDGALKGFAVGAFIGSTIGAEGCLHSPLWHCTVFGGIDYAVLGVVIDAMHRGRTTVYRAGSSAGPGSVQLMPQLAPHQKSVTLAWSFK